MSVRFRQVLRPSYAQILCRSSETEQGLECGRRPLAAVVPKDELIQIDLELSSTHAVVGADQPLLEVANRAISERHCRFRAFAEFGSPGLSASDVFETDFRKTLKALEAIRVDGGVGRDVLGLEVPYLKINPFHQPGGLVPARGWGGGMGEVFRATDTKLGHEVALKVIS